MENSTNLDYGNDALDLTNSIRLSFQNMAKWGYFLSILGFIFVGLMVIAAVFIGGSFSYFGSEFGDFGSGFGILFSIIYLAMAALYLYPTWLLYKFSDEMKKSLRDEDQLGLELSLKNLSKLFTFWGILTIIFLALYVLTFLGMSIFSAAML